jgi:hypothetical protein
MAILSGNSGSYLFIGPHAERPQPANIAAGAIARAYETDSRTFWTWINEQWIQEAKPPEPPPPATPPDNQLLCDVAGVLIKQVCKQLIVNAVNTFGASGILQDFVLGAILAIPGIDVAAVVFAGAYIFFDVLDSGVIGQFVGAIASNALWNSLGCVVYNALLSISDWTTATADDIAHAVETAPLGFPDVLSTIAKYIVSVGLGTIMAMAQLGKLMGYNCSSCAMHTGGQQTGGPTIQNYPQLTVTDGSTTEHNVQTIRITGATVSGSGTEADVTIAAGETLTISDGTTTVPDVTSITFPRSTVTGPGSAAIMDHKDDQELIGTYTVFIGGVNTIDIPVDLTGYAHMLVEILARGNGTEDDDGPIFAWLTLNEDTGNNYYWNIRENTVGSTTTSTVTTTVGVPVSNIALGQIPNGFTDHLHPNAARYHIMFPYAADPLWQKGCIIHGAGLGNDFTSMNGEGYRINSQDAITSVQFTTPVGAYSFASGTRMSIYGIRDTH